MSRLIDADAIISFVDVGHFRNPLELAWSDNDVVDMIDKQPTFDMALVMKKPIETSTIELLKEGGLKLEVRSEVVRCSECKFYIGSNEKCMLIDTRLHFYETDNTWVGDCFCCWGKRKEKNDE